MCNRWQECADAILEHPRVTRTIRDDLVERIGINTLTQSERHCLRRCSNVDAREKLVDDLDPRALPVPIAEPVNLVRDRCKHVFAFCVGLGRTRRHHRHRALGSLDGTAREGCVDQEDTAFSKPLAELFGILREHRRTRNDNATLPKRAGRARITEKHRVGLFSINDYRDNYVAGRSKRSGIGAGNTAFGLKLPQHFRPHVVCVGVESGTQKRARDTKAHRTKTDDSD